MLIYKDMFFLISSCHNFTTNKFVATLMYSVMRSFVIASTICNDKNCRLPHTLLFMKEY